VSNVKVTPRRRVSWPAPWTPSRRFACFVPTLDVCRRAA
jgi:hypothetical protein